VLPSLLAAGLVLGLFSRLLDPRTLLELVPVGVLWVAACVLAVWFLGLDDSDRSVVSGRLGMLRFRRPLASASD